MTDFSSVADSAKLGSYILAEWYLHMRDGTDIYRGVAFGSILAEFPANYVLKNNIRAHRTRIAACNIADWFSVGNDAVSQGCKLVTSYW